MEDLTRQEFQNNLETARKLWKNFGNVPLTNDRKTTKRWDEFPKSTDCDEIWLWFEEKFNISVVYDLMRML